MGLEELVEKLEERMEKPTAFVDDGEHVRRGDVDVDVVHWGFLDRRRFSDNEIIILSICRYELALVNEESSCRSKQTE